MKVLAGDLGGTKALLGIADLSATRPHFLLTRRLASADFSGLPELLAAFRSEVGAAFEGVAAACLAVAGPVEADGRHARFTNLPWQADAAELETQLGVPVRLANDFVAVAAACEALDDDQRLVLQPGEPLADGLRLVIGAGTGLGMAALLPERGRCRILPGEGGHVAFAPADETQLPVWSALQARHGRVTAERVISGPGLAAIHEILAGECADPAAIGARALAGEASACRSVGMFLSAYGAFAGDMALALLARGGVFLAGGVTQHLLPLLAGSGFLAAFNAKAEHAGLARRMPVFAVRDPAIGLKGAAMLLAP